MSLILDQFKIFITAVFLLGISGFAVSCKSIARAHADSAEFAGKQPISNPTKMRKPAPQRATPSRQTKKSPSKIAPKPANPLSKAKTKVMSAPATKVIDDESYLLKEIPKVDKSKAKVVPGVEELIPLNGPIRIREDSPNRIIDAQGRDVIVSGDDCVVIIKGGCGKLSLNGKNNQIQCDSVVQVEISGSKNSLILGTLGGGTIRGNNNDLSWGSGLDGLSPIVESYGSDNSMKRLE